LASGCAPPSTRGLTATVETKGRDWNHRRRPRLSGDVVSSRAKGRKDVSFTNFRLDWIVKGAAKSLICHTQEIGVCCRTLRV